MYGSSIVIRNFQEEKSLNKNKYFTTLILGIPHASSYISALVKMKQNLICQLFKLKLITDYSFQFARKFQIYRKIAQFLKNKAPEKIHFRVSFLSMSPCYARQWNCVTKDTIHLQYFPALGETWHNRGHQSKLVMTSGTGFWTTKPSKQFNR